MPSVASRGTTVTPTNSTSEVRRRAWLASLYLPLSFATMQVSPKNLYAREDATARTARGKRGEDPC